MPRPSGSVKLRKDSVTKMDTLQNSCSYRRFCIRILTLADYYGVNAHQAGRGHHHEVELSLIMERWYRVMDSPPEARDHPHRDLFPTQITLAKYCKEPIMDKIGQLKNCFTAGNDDECV